MKKQLLVAATVAAIAAGASAQQVWRCGDSYQQKPCPGGSAVAVDDRRSAAEAAKSRAETDAEWRRATAMEKDRLAQEKNAGKALVIGGMPQTPASAPRPPAPHHKKKKQADPEEFSAVDPATVHHRK